MSKTYNKISKYRKPKQPNIGLIIFSVIFLYIIINVFVYMNKEHLSIYEVVEGKNADNNICTGFVLRNEKIEYTDKAGYINYYVKDSERISKNSTVYTIDESGTIYDKIKNSDVENQLSSQNISDLSNDVLRFKKNFSKDNYSLVYNFKYDIENTILEINSYNILNNPEQTWNIGSDNSFSIQKANQSGIITFSIDGMENIIEDDITEKTFDTSSFARTQLRTTDLLDKNSPVYKIVTDENWSIILMLTKEQFEKTQEKSVVNITFLKDDFSTKADITSYQKGDGYYAKLDLNKYMIRYISDRYLEIEISINSAKGLKIPISSILEKEFYKIPLECFTTGGNSEKKGIIKESYSENGEVEFVFIQTDVFYEDEEYGYIDTTTINAGDWIRIEDTQERYQVNLIDKLLGVYNVNKGYAIFKRIEKLYENEEYSIIRKDTPYGLAVYDNIVLNSNTIVEQAIIY